MINDENSSDNTFSLSYNFKSEEIALLAKFFRNNQDKIPAGLELFERAVQDSVYNALSLEQIRKFYEN